MKIYRSREGNITASDTKTQLTTLGSETAPGPLLVPQFAKSLHAVIHVVSNDIVAAQEATHFIRLEGPGLKNGPEAFVSNSVGVVVATGGNGAFQAHRIELGLEVTAGQEILCFAEMAGTDPGTSTAGISLEFSTDAPLVRDFQRTLTVEGLITAIDTQTPFTTQGSIVAPSRLVPQGAKKIDQILFSTASDGAAAGNASMFLRLGGAAVRNGEQTIFFGGHGKSTVQSGGDGAPNLGAYFHLMDADIEVSPGDTIDIVVEHAGVDTGNVQSGVTLLYA